MAQLKDSIIQGNLRVSDSTLTDTLQTTTIEAPTTSGGTTYGAGSNGQALMSNGTTSYWGNLTTYSAMTQTEIDAGTSGTSRIISPANLKYGVQTWSQYICNELEHIIGSGGSASANLFNIINDDNGFVTRLANIDIIYSGTYLFGVDVGLDNFPYEFTFYNSDDLVVGSVSISSSDVSSDMTAIKTLTLTGNAVKMRCPGTPSLVFPKFIITQDTNSFYQYIKGSSYNPFTDITDRGSSPLSGKADRYDVTRLKGTTAEIIDTSSKNRLPLNSITGTGAWAKDVDCLLPPGDYVIYFGSLDSTDTDSNKNQLGFFTSSYASAVKNGALPLITRGDDVFTSFTLVDTAVKFRLYSSNSVAHGSGDTVTATNVMVCPKSYWDISNTYESYCPTLPEIHENQSKNTAALINLIDTGNKNLMPTPNGQSTPPTRWVNVSITLSPGTYRVFFGNLQSDDTNDTKCQACFLSGSTQVSNWLTFDRGTDVFSGVCTITEETTTFRLYPSTSYVLSEGDTVTFSDGMICKECDWQISQTYVPYQQTNEELYAMRYVHDSTQINLNDITWTRSGGGLYYSDTITIPNSPVVRTYHATLSGFGNIRATDIITPAVRRSSGWEGFLLYANTNSFLSGAWVTISVSGLPN